jgi:nucleoside-diphosphate-sugar epimerase
MKIFVTGGTGFIGRYILRHFAGLGHTCRALHRPTSDRSGLDDIVSTVEWAVGELGDGREAERVAGCDAVVHSALYHPGGGFHGGEGDLSAFLRTNVLGTIELIEAARAAGVGRFVFVSTCAVHERIYQDRPLDETHPTTPSSHYGAHKAALEQFVHSYGWGQKYPICALRPTGVYGTAHPPSESKYFDLVRAIVRGEDVTCERGGKEVHAADVAKAAGILLTAEYVEGEAFNCYDRYISEYDVANIARRLCGSRSTVNGTRTQPKNQIVTEKLRHLGMQFGGDGLLQRTVKELIEAAG